MRLDNNQVKGHELTVTGNLRIDSEDMSGQTSSSSRAHKGFKPKTLNCNMKIKYRQQSELSSLIGLAEAVDETGELHVYTIVHPTAQAMNIRQVRFMDNLSARESESLKEWSVSFTLVEHLSVAEKVENRQPEKGVETQEPSGDEVQTEADNNENYTGFEKVLKNIDDALARESE